ncbi:glycosyltransferase [Pedobacter sp. HMWF019]|uniref:glycosyltransferase n=1 Tax=Pedobacter sp. HMWF019 TaxID=2056856 RepID=UPI001304873F|nr:glycosyltransferase [Pedobacter sp. HMWF019]
MKKEIASIVILYNPNWNLLKEVINEASTQCCKVFAIDNSIGNNRSIFESSFNELENVVYYPLLDNFGIAHAQNVGLEFVKDYEYVVFLDQDSIPFENMVKTLIEDFKLLRLHNVQVATIGPQPVNSQTNNPYEPRLFKNKDFIIDGVKFFQTKQIISSGGLMLVKDFNEIGHFEELLFIDGVDHEWCWRAKKYGYQTFLSTRTSLVHSLGEGDRKIAGFDIATTSSFRLYYQYRNFIILLFRGYVPFYWKLNSFIKYIVKMVYYPVVNKDINILKRIIVGIKDGFKIILENK